MGNLSNIGRIFYGIAIAAMGLLTIYDRDFPYMMIPPKHSWISDHVLLVYLFGALLFLAGACIVIEKILVPVSLLLGAVLLSIFCFYFVPYEFLVSPNYMHFGDWENAAKELALAGGAIAVAGHKKWIRLGVVLFAITIISFGTDHFLYAKEASDYIPSWVPAHLFWMYFCGLALLGSGIAILFNIKPRLSAVLLGAMIFIWVVILHIPRVIAFPIDNQSGEVTSAFLALSYCGIAFVIAGANKKGQLNA
jgi:uncharacterized membrane protein YphA (DoxX/SURF4 family)